MNHYRLLDCRTHSIMRDSGQPTSKTCGIAAIYTSTSQPTSMDHPVMRHQPATRCKPPSISPAAELPVIGNRTAWPPFAICRSFPHSQCWGGGEPKAKASYWHPNVFVAVIKMAVFAGELPFSSPPFLLVIFFLYAISGGRHSTVSCCPSVLHFVSRVPSSPFVLHIVLWDNQSAARRSLLFSSWRCPRHQATVPMLA
ncbi:hypothetical protein FA95DRAFT_303099 [Auriscalpium vulgare]|uniref:Uncharacterized protein n=1 Tax=Auriscalpium vulgare TaxID=40419 RepID=A0ACB8RIW6_9AGAM|nr:hypothetical protein FA95DRAFT_303099 [Auriscalpium vulgare]